VILLPVHTPGSSALPLTVLSRTGQIVGGSPDMLAATSVGDLEALTGAELDRNAAAPTYWLLAVPLDGLPSAVLTVAVDFPRAGLFGRAVGQPLKLAGGSTTVDLQSPRPNQADRVTSSAELQGVVQSARQDARWRLPGNPLRLIDLALRRWPRADLGGGSGPNVSDLPWGSLIVIRVATSTNVLAYEYHELAGRTVFCRELTA
jgi:hypothetical protein